MEKLFIILLPFAFCLFLAWLFSRIAQNKERILLIEKGINPDEYLKRERERSPDNTWMKVGIVVIGMSLGLMAVSLLHSIGTIRMSDGSSIAAFGIFTGASLIVANYIGKNKN